MWLKEDLPDKLARLYAPVQWTWDIVREGNNGPAEGGQAFRQTRVEGEAQMGECDIRWHPRLKD